MTAVCLLHSADDQAFAGELSEFLEAGCDLVCRTGDGLLNPGESIVHRAGQLGLSGDVLLIVLSASSCAAGWPDRKQWESVLVTQAKELEVAVAYVQTDNCNFPGVFRKQLFDARLNRLHAFRRLKRWMWTRESPESKVSSEFEKIYAGVADAPGMMAVPGAAVKRFAEEASAEFAAVVWVPCHRRSLAQIVGHLGVELQMSLEGPVNENLDRVMRVLSERRCLVVLDGIAPETQHRLTAMGRSSTLATIDPVIRLETIDSYASARELVQAGRLAEAHEMCERMDDLKSRREIAWILNRWGLETEANATYPDLQPYATQMSLFG